MLINRPSEVDDEIQWFHFQYKIISEFKKHVILIHACDLTSIL